MNFWNWATLDTLSLQILYVFMSTILSSLSSSKWQSSCQTSLRRILESLLLKTGRTFRGTDATKIWPAWRISRWGIAGASSSSSPLPHPLREEVFLWRSSEPIIICIVLIRSASSGSLECLMACNAPLFLRFSCSDFSSSAFSSRSLTHRVLF